MTAVNPKSQIEKARELEHKGFLLQATRIYEEAIESLRIMIDGTPDGEKKIQYLVGVGSLEDYLLQVKQRIQTPNRSVISLRIAEGAIGYSYDKIFGAYLDDEVREVHIYESYTFEDHHFENLNHFFDMLLKRCNNMRYVWLFTKKTHPKTRNDDFRQRITVFKQWVNQFKDCSIDFRYELRNNVHDRRIELSNGVTFVLGYGLDIYQRRPKFSIGSSNYDLRKCKETYVDILQPLSMNCCSESENLI